MAFEYTRSTIFRGGGDCDIDQYLVIAKVRERLAENKQIAQKFDVERFNSKELNELEFRKQYQIQISKSSAGLDNLSNGEEINRFWRNLKENIKTSDKESQALYKLKQHKPWFDEKCSQFLDQRKQAKMQ